MSFTKTVLSKDFLKPITEIQDKTLNENDFALISKYLNATLDIYENITESDSNIGELWNEIVSDTISSIHAALSGFYRSSIVILRSILELGCNSFFYLDHKIEYDMFQNYNLKADNYVTTLINNYFFFTTKYIYSFNNQISTLQTEEDSVSTYLRKHYGVLSDNVHGRYKYLTKAKGLQLKYDIGLFKRYEKLLFETLSLLAVMYVLRFKDKSNSDIVELANITKVVKI